MDKRFLVYDDMIDSVTNQKINTYVFGYYKSRESANDAFNRLKETLKENQIPLITRIPGIREIEWEE